MEEFTISISIIHIVKNIYDLLKNIQVAEGWRAAGGVAGRGRAARPDGARGGAPALAQPRRRGAGRQAPGGHLDTEL